MTSVQANEIWQEAGCRGREVHDIVSEGLRLGKGRCPWCWSSRRLSGDFGMNDSLMIGVK